MRTYADAGGRHGAGLAGLEHKLEAGCHQKPDGGSVETGKRPAGLSAHATNSRLTVILSCRAGCMPCMLHVGCVPDAVGRYVFQDAMQPCLRL